MASLIPDSMFPANYAQKGSIKGLFYMDAGEQIAEFHGGEVFNMVPPQRHGASARRSALRRQRGAWT